MHDFVCAEISLGGEKANSSQRILRGVWAPPKVHRCRSNYYWSPTSNFLVFPAHLLYYVSGIYLQPSFHVLYHKPKPAMSPLNLHGNVLLCLFLPNSIAQGSSLPLFLQSSLHIISPRAVLIFTLTCLLPPLPHSLIFQVLWSETFPLSLPSILSTSLYRLCTFDF